LVNRNGTNFCEEFLLIFTQVQLSALISPSECTTNLCTAAEAEVAYQK